jgi:hypothetical protein
LEQPLVGAHGRLRDLAYPCGSQEPGRPLRIFAVLPTLAAAPARARVTNWPSRSAEQRADPDRVPIVLDLFGS